MTEGEKKDDLYQFLSDVSKDVNGYRMRLDVDEYTVAELEEIIERLLAQNRRQLDEADKAAERGYKAHRARHAWATVLRVGLPGVVVRQPRKVDLLDIRKGK